MSSHSTSPRAAAILENIDQLRSLHGVRLLKLEEEGCSTARLEPGVYGYAHALGQPETPLFAKKSFHSFEVHKASDGTEYLIGFVTAPEAADLAARKEGAAIKLFPDPWVTSQTLVSVRVEDILPPKRMPREDGNPFPVTIA